MKKFFNEFKEFAMKGNIVDMALGVVIGSAFGKIVSSLVADIITPLISLLTGEVSLTGLKYVFKPEAMDPAGNVIQQEIALNYGNFIQSVIDFFIIALSIFLVLKILMSVKNKFETLMKKEEEAKEEEEENKPTQEELLEEIRDLLKAQNEKEE